MIAEANPTGRISEARAEAEYERWTHWPINWSAVFVGALAALAAVLIIGLIGLAVGAHLLGPDQRVVDLKKISITALIFSVAGAFFAFAIGGWVAGKVAGILHSEPAILHGVIVWLVAVPVIVVLAGLGAASLFGGWYGGLAGSPAGASSAALPFEKPDPLLTGATPEDRDQYKAAMNDYHDKVKQWQSDTPRVTRNTALGAVTAVLLGLVGSVIGGWMACGEPMNLSYYRTRPKRVHTHDVRVKV